MNLQICFPIARDALRCALHVQIRVVGEIGRSRLLRGQWETGVTCHRPGLPIALMASTCHLCWLIPRQVSG